mmetsp:Transcript_68265/g.173366  ORF Transcript_68265/g.173366 Transcript_68265/m.173366 type:complete len:385 (-) Transcript_68265:42-1196(-)
MIVDQLLRVDGGPGNLALSLHRDRALGETLPNQLPDLRRLGVRLYEDESAVPSIARIQCDKLRQARLDVHVLQSIENRALLLALQYHLRILRPRRKTGLPQAPVQQHLAKGVLLHRPLQPVHALRQPFKGRRRGMHAVVAVVGGRGQTQLLPALQDRAPHRAQRRSRRVRRPQNLASEVGPAQDLRVPGHGEVVDRSSRGRELRAHGHEEGVEDIQHLATDSHFAAVEATTELHKVARLLAFPPLRRQLRSSDAEGLASLQCICCLLGCEGLLPSLPELLLKLRRGHRQLRGLQKCGLGRDGIVVLIDKLLGIDNRPCDLALGVDLDVPLGEQLARQLAHPFCLGVGLHEDEGAVDGHLCRVQPPVRRPAVGTAIIAHGEARRN